MKTTIIHVGTADLIHRLGQNKIDQTRIGITVHDDFILLSFQVPDGEPLAVFELSSENAISLEHNV